MAAIQDVSTLKNKTRWLPFRLYVLLKIETRWLPFRMYALLKIETRWLPFRMYVLLKIKQDGCHLGCTLDIL